MITPLGGPVVSNVYNTANNNPQGRLNALEFTMDGNGLITRYIQSYNYNGTQTQQKNQTIHEWYDDQGAKHQDVNNPSSDSKTVTDGSGRVISSTDANGQTTSTFYNSLGQVIDVQDPYSGHTYTLYDIRGNAVATIYPDGTETRSVYDAAGRVIWSTERFASSTSINYFVPSSGNAHMGTLNIASFDNSGSSVATYTTYDDLGRVSGTKRYSNVSISLALDPQGGGMADAAIFSVSFTDTDDNQIPDGAAILSSSSTMYDDQGRVSTSTDASGLISGTIYYPNGQVHYSGQVLSNADAAGYSRTRDFDANRKLVNVTESIPNAYAADQIHLSGDVEAGDDFTLTIRPRSVGDLTLPTGNSLHYNALSSDTWDSVLAYFQGQINTLSSQVDSPFYGISVSAGTDDDLILGGSKDWLLSVSQTLAPSPSRTTIPSFFVTSGVVSQWTSDALGHTTVTIQDDLGRTVQTVNADGTSTHTIYGVGNLPVVDHQVTGQVITGHQETSIDAYGGVTDTFYDATGRVTDVYAPSVADAENGGAPARPHTHYDYDLFDSIGRYDQVIDPRGLATRSYKDNLGRVIERVEVGDPSTTSDDAISQTLYGTPQTAIPGHEIWTQIIDGYQITRIDALGQPTDYFYDRFDRLTDVYLPTVTDNRPLLDDGTTANPNFGQPMRPHWHCAYDALGRQTAQVDPYGHTTTFAYNDPSGNRTERTLLAVNGTTVTEHWMYDNLGRSQTHTDFDGQVTLYVYDNQSSVSATEQRYQGNVVYEYRFPSITAYGDYQADSKAHPPAETTHYVYNDLGQQTEVHETSSTAPSRDSTSSTTWDLQNHIRQEISNTPEGTITHEYDIASGRLLRTFSDDVELVYGYDAQGRLENVYTTRQKGVTYATYTGLVNLQPTFTNGTPLTTTYGYDTDGNLASINQQLSQSEFILTQNTFNSLNQLDLEEVTDQNNNLLASYDYTVRPDGQRTSVLETEKQLGGGFSVTRIDWSYDAEDRLLAETRDEGNDHTQNGNDYSNVFALDLVGNRVLKQRGWDADGNGQLDAGETITSTTAYAYNQRDQLVSEGPDTNSNWIPDPSYEHRPKLAECRSRNLSDKPLPIKD